MKKGLEHYLLSIPINTGYAHAHVITGDPRDTLVVTEELMDLLEAQMLTSPMSGIVLQTLLDAENAKRVMAFLDEQHPEVAATRKKMRAFHRTAWLSPPSGPGVDWLMEIH